MSGPVSDEQRAYILMRRDQRRKTALIERGGFVRTGKVVGDRMRRAQADVARTASADRVHRATDPVERARLFLQQRHFVVYAATVLGGPPGHWRVVGRQGFVTSDELLALATKKGFSA